jgi:hypothetical protein
LSDADKLKVGQVLCDPDFPVPQVKRFRTKIITLDNKLPIIPGCRCVLFMATCQEQVTIRLSFSFFCYLSFFIFENYFLRQQTYFFESWRYHKEETKVTIKFETFDLLIIHPCVGEFQKTADMLKWRSLPIGLCALRHLKTSSTDFLASSPFHGSCNISSFGRF